MDIVTIVLQGLLGLAFLMAGIGKVGGLKMHVDHFKLWGLPQWFRVVTGLVELIGAAALILGIWEPSWAAAGSLLLGVTMIGAILVHIRLKDKAKETMPSVVLFILAAVIFIIQYGELAQFPGFNKG
ncbi:DoxX family protein [Paenibacillus sp. FJAT-27812]|uniref:DoxX family protein n=1 Tax=Paenibacillus sp. FJAT-27812 TaxID=1684143 RepID=UPI0006A786A4|nr:DoxX family protein [Paenibacillus sp. FJAT-27812]